MGETRLLKYYGSKIRLAEKIVSLMPSHRVYLEPYFGSGAVFFAKPKALYEVLNDVDSEVSNFFRVIRDDSEALARLVDLTPWSRDEYAACANKTENPTERARRFAVRCWQAFGGNIGSGWSRDMGARTQAQTHTWNLLPDRIRNAAARLKDAYIENRAAEVLIPEYNRPDVLVYADPPYLHETRTSNLGYGHEMTTAEHETLLRLLREHTGFVIISGYASDLYDSALSDWGRIVLNGTTQRNLPREEVLWLNRRTTEDEGQMMLREVTHG